jgi:carboxyl-terminal processing protease
LTLLVNKGTASASEVLAGALRDNSRARVLGDSETFGKGLIQTLIPLSDGSAVSVTVARYQTPSGADINKVGIAPDAPLPRFAAAVGVGAGAGAGEESGEEEAAGVAAAAGAELPVTPDAFCSVLAADSGVATKLFS